MYSNSKCIEQIKFEDINILNTYMPYTYQYQFQGQARGRLQIIVALKSFLVFY